MRVTSLASRAEYYREMAAQSAERAAKAVDPLVKKTYQDLNRQWLHLAQHAERAVTGGPTPFLVQPEPREPTKHRGNPVAKRALHVRQLS